MHLKSILVFLLLFICSLSKEQTHRKNLKFVSKMNDIAVHTVLLNNRQKIIPLTALDKKEIAVVNFGLSSGNIIDSMLNKYAYVKAVNAAQHTVLSGLNSLEDELEQYNTAIILLDKKSIRQPKTLQFINNVSVKKNMIIVFFGKGKMLRTFDKINAPVIWYKKENDVAAFVVPQIIFGGTGAQGKLDKTYSARYIKGDGDNTSGIRLKYTVPEELNINADDLKSIDTIARFAIAQHATPGLVVLAARDGKVFYNKAYGTHTYDDTITDKITDLFDMASVTKITATTPTVMRLYDEGKLNLDSTIGFYLERARTAPMNDIHVREVMLHQAGFVPFIPFYNEITPGDYAKDSSACFPTKVADNFYIKKDYFNNVMWPRMMQSPIKTRGKYVYSDISMYTMQQIVEHLTGIPLNEFAADTFYAPLGMQSAGYLPRHRFAENKIIPTEDDTSFRHQLLIGYVHDEGAALKGGVAGHAGLFASSIDLAIYYQMLLNKGSYGGMQYFRPQTVEYFTGKRSEVSRRGLGFDRADTSLHYPSRTASAQTFGHTGFTGTCVWVDPKRNLVYIFLSNRVNPHRGNQLIHLNIRSKMEDVFDEAIDKAIAKQRL